MDKLLRVTVHGATIASTLYAVTTGGAPCDGLLFGDTVTTTTQHLRDDDDTATVTEARAVISSTLCCASTCSFYDETGDLAEPVLEDLSRQQSAPLLGWLSYRPAAPASGASAAASAAAGSSSSAASPCPAGPSSLRPSMREAAVTHALLRRQAEQLGGRQAVLLLLVTSGLDHNGATVTWQYRCFQARRNASTGDLLMEPVHLQTLNLGGHVGQAAYHDLAAASGGAGQTSPGAGAGSSAQAPSPQHPVRITFASSTAGTSTATQPPSQAAGATGGGAAGGSPPAVGTGGGAGSGLHGSPLKVAATGAINPGSGGDPAALGALAAGARAQVAAVKQHCESLLVGLHELCGQAVAGEAAVAALRARRDALLSQLARAP